MTLIITILQYAVSIVSALCIAGVCSAVASIAMASMHRTEDILGRQNPGRASANKLFANVTWLWVAYMVFKTTLATVQG